MHTLNGCSNRSQLKEPVRTVHFEKRGCPGIAADDGSGWHGLAARESGFPGTLPELTEALKVGAEIYEGELEMNYLSRLSR